MIVPLLWSVVVFAAGFGVGFWVVRADVRVIERRVFAVFYGPRWRRNVVYLPFDSRLAIEHLGCGIYGKRGDSYERLCLPAGVACSVTPAMLDYESVTIDLGYDMHVRESDQPIIECQ